MKKEKRLLLILIFLALLGSLLTAGAETPGYAAYLAGFSEAAYPQEALQADLRDAGIPLRDDPLHQRGEVLMLERPGDAVSLLVKAPQAGLYQLEIDYLALPARAGSIEISILINGEIPFLQSKGNLLRRLFHTPGPITRDSRGHDVRPEMVEQMAWQSVRVQDHNNHFAQPFYYYLSQGENRVGIRLLAESVALAGLRFLPAQAPPAYSEYASRYPAAGSAGSILIQAEEAGLRSSEVIYALAARGDAALHPSDPVKTRLNTIGGYAWRQQGEWVEWIFDAPEDGWYALSMHLLNDFVRGMPSTRRLWVDGSVPFMEAQAVSIPYAIAWQDFRLEGADGRSLPLYLSRGQHSLRLEVAPGENAGTLRRLEEAIARMNLLYRRIIVITGDNADGSRVSIDLNRDFHLETKIPGLLEDLASLSATLRQEYAAMSAYAGRGSEAALLNQAAIQLDSFIDRPDLIPARLESYKGNLSSLSSWVLYMREQPLQIDSIALTGTAGTPPANGVTIFDRIGFRWQGFVGSFMEDYSAVGEVYSSQAVRPLQVWVCANDLGATGISSGRDQTQVIKELIDQYFVPKSGIPVNLSLIDGSSTLMQATLGGKGPDVALTVYKELPVNLAMRGALLDLSQFKGFRELLPAFHESALLPYRYKGGVYALPETQNFDMIFYRADIFEEMGLQVPQTWEDLRALVPVLQKQGMQIGIAAPTVTNNNTAGFQAQLFQRGLNYYTADQTRTTFDEAGALDAFKAWTELYTKYSLPIQYDMFSRFRTGEMPLAIASYVTANTLAAGAPELTGLWGLAPIPGTRRSDGSIDRSQGATGTGVILLANTSLPDQAFTFASWWTSSQTQAQFALALESLMGSAARWPTANREAFLHIKWTQQQQEALLTQWEDVDDIPQLPGNYITNRNLTFAFRAVVYNNKTPREVLNRYNKEINKEIQRKWEEFGQ
ncbi:MAG: extracellular solute-binding protein [Christensenellales bacterium]